MKDRKYFAFFASFFDAIDECPLECQRDIYRAIALYGIRHEEMPLTGVAKAIFISLKPVLDNGWKQYNNGNKGGAPTGNKNAAKENPKTTQKQPNNNPKTTKEKIENKKETIEDTTVSMSSPDDAQCACSIDFDNLMHYFNSKMQTKAIATITKMTPKRKNAVNARMVEYGKEAIRTVIDNAADSTFLNGGGDNGFVASFDWIFRPNNFPKVLEGNYANHTRQKKTYNGSGSTPEERMNHAAELIMRLSQEGVESDDDDDVQIESHSELT